MIDQGRRIGCRACTVEHGIELGVFRTEVKHVERGLDRSQTHAGASPDCAAIAAPALSASRAVLWGRCSRAP